MPTRKRSSSRRGKGRGKASRRVSFRGKKVDLARKGTRRGKGKSASSLQLPMEGPKTMEDVKFNSYIRKVLRKVNPSVNLNSNSMKIMDSLMKDTLHSIAETAACKMGKRKTLKPKAILRAMKHVMPRNLALTVDEHAQRALERYGRKARRC
ncbi:histone H2B [Elysia marginata]|uniref:Histone H2B n=1 Tax=Elysia marginata TaxID=1093978 RepID=A0AAV4FJR5_9GAST|nr:histone H2B [Elysia marginata]